MAACRTWSLVEFGWGVCVCSVADGVDGMVVYATVYAVSYVRIRCRLDLDDCGEGRCRV